MNPFTYRGYCYDDDIGMYYLPSRYYDPEICRFINADSTDYLGASGGLLSYNLFAYCENDPVMNVDVNQIVLGGNILTEKLEYNYDNWFYNVDPNKNLQFNVFKSIEMANEYILKYIEKNGNTYRVVFVID